MALAALIPAKAETSSLEDVLARLRQALPGVRVLVVTDYDDDPAAGVARRAGVEVLHSGPSGYVGAVHAGIQALSRHGVERLVLLDADGQHPPEAAPLLVARLAQADVVYASRQGTHSPGSVYRRLGNRLLSTWLHLLTGTRLHDVTSGFAALGPRAIDVLATRTSGGFGDAGVRARLLTRGLEVLEQPVHIAARNEGTSMHRGPAAAAHFLRSLMDVPQEIRIARRERDAERMGFREA